ncbi:hypothetical protein RB195_015272 [Necator americanus]|uniref:Uncharacterized protein n=1 Tax=Necator americanus TaxID=51031 RepID=A0ABR1E403_NECAM
MRPGGAVEEMNSSTSGSLFSDNNGQHGELTHVDITVKTLLILQHIILCESQKRLNSLGDPVGTSTIVITKRPALLLVTTFYRTFFDTVAAAIIDRCSAGMNRVDLRA